MSAKQKSNRIKPRLPRGFTDRGAAEIAATRRMVATIRAVYERYGFEPVETPAIEFTEALGKFLPDQDRPNEGVFSFQDDDEQWLSLRYDLTAPLARYVAENFDALPKPYRSYREGYVFRNEKPGPGRFRQFMQFDADTVGSASPAADAEMCMMAADALEALGIPRGSYVIKVNNRKVLDGVMESIGVTDEQQRLKVLRAIDKHDRLGEAGVRKLLGAGRWDGGEEGKGDFTQGAELSPEQIDRVMLYVGGMEALTWGDVSQVSDAERRRLDNPRLGEMKRFVSTTKEGQQIETWIYKSNLSALKSLHANFGVKNELCQSGIDELQELVSICNIAGFGYDQVRIDPSVVRGLEYYTGPVYEAELTFEINDEKGRPVRFGSVGGGGRYDGLIGRFRAEPVPATGFSIGVSRLQSALTALGKLGAEKERGPVVVTVFDRERIADYQRMVTELRTADIRAELYLGNPKNFGNQLKYADRRNSPCVVIQGGDEKNHRSGVPHVQIKDLILGAEIATLSTEREDYLKKQAEAQFACPEDQLVEKVREVLARKR
jgi:histidyl-tRNA synthetase